MFRFSRYVLIFACLFLLTAIGPPPPVYPSGDPDEIIERGDQPLPPPFHRDRPTVPPAFQSGSGDDLRLRDRTWSGQSLKQDLWDHIRVMLAAWGFIV